MRVYVAGPMRGFDQFNFPAFDEAREWLRNKGYVVFCPAEHDRAGGFDETKNSLDGFDMCTAFAWDVEHVLKAEGIVLLPGWSQSEGAAFEREVAERTGRRVWYYNSDPPRLEDYPNPADAQGDARFHALLVQIGQLHDAKQVDYGADSDPFANVRASSEWGISPWIGAMVRGTDKVKRLQTFAQRGTLRNEGVEDSLMDLAVYALIALILFREEGDAG